MKKIYFFIFLSFISLLSFSQSTTVVLSQVYGGGGASTGSPTYNCDYVELHNISNSAQLLNGMSLQYGSSTGNFGSSTSNIYAIPNGTSIPAGGYLLVQLSPVGTAGAALAVTPDLVTTNLTMSATAGKVVLANQTTALGCGATATPCPLPSATIIDLVAYGSSNNGEGGASTPILSTTSAAVRKNNGCTETDNNLADFDVIPSPVPRNSASTAFNCGASGPSLTATPATIPDFGNVNVSTNSSSQSFSLSGSNLTGAPGNITVTAPSTDFQVSNNNSTWGASTTIAYSSATLASTNVYVRFTPQTTGFKSGNISISGGGGSTSAFVSGTGISISPILTASPTTIPDYGNVNVGSNSSSQSFTLSGSSLTGFPGNITVTAPSTDFQVSNDNSSWGASTAIAYSSATLSNTPVYIRFTPQSGGVKSGNVAVSGGGASTINVAVSGTGVAATSSPTIVISQLYGGGGASTGSPTYNCDYVELHNNGTTAQILNGTSLQYGSSTGNFGSSTSNIYAIPNGTSIPAGGYLLVQLSPVGTAGAALPVTPDLVTTNLTMSATAGKVVLANQTTTLGCGATATPCPLPSSAIIDLVAYGSSNNAEGGAAVPALSTTSAAVRKNNGCTETDNNLADFDVITSPVPRNSSSTIFSCSVGPLLTAIPTTVPDFGNINAGSNSTSQSFSLSGSNLTGAPGNITVTAPSTDFQVSNNNSTWGASTTIAYSSATLASTNVYVRFTPQSGGFKSGSVSISGGGATTITVAVSGTGVSATLSAAPTTIPDFGNVTVLTNSSSQSFNLSGTFLTGAPGTITVTAPSTDFQVSNNNTTWGASTTIAYSSATLGSTPVYVRFTPQTTGFKSGNVTISGGGATAITVAVSGTAVPPPASLSATPTTLPDFGNVVILTNSSSQSFNLSGANLTGAPGNITITAPSTDFQVSNDNSAWGASTTIAYSSATLSSTPVYVRFTPQTTGFKSGNVTINGGGASSITVSVSGTGVNPTPTLIATPTTLPDFGNIVVGTNSASQSFTLSGANLTGAPGNITITAPSADFQVSNDNSGWGASTTIAYSSSNLPATNVYVRFTPQTTGFKSGNISISGGSATATVAVSGTGVPPPPVLTATPNVIPDFGNVAVLTNSSSQSFNLSGSNLTGAPGTITVSAPSTDFQVSNNNTTWGASTTIAFATATLSSTPLYVRFIPQIAGFKSGNITVNGGGASTTVAVSGTGVTPSITTTALTAFGNVCTNTTAGPNSFTITGTNLSNANINVAALAGFTYSTTAAGTYTTSLSLAQTGGSYSQTIFVKFTPTAVQSYNGNILVDGGGVASPVNVAASGAGVNTAPGVTTGAASSITFNSATAAGSITATGCSAVSAYGIEYSTTNNFPNGSGTQVASTNLSGGNFSSNLTGLAPGTAYYYKAYATNGGGTSYGAQQTFTTAVLPIALTATPLTAFGTACTNAIAGPNSFTINGVFLTNANVNVGPLAGFTFSTTANGTYAPSLSLTQPGGTYTQTVYVKFNPTAIQSYNGNIPVTGGGAASINVAASGSGVNTPPTVTTGSSSNITNHDVVLEGRIPNNGCSNITSAGIEFSGIRNFANGTGAQAISTNLAAGIFSVHLDNVVQGTKYYYRAWATNNGGISYGAIDSFTVTSIPNGFTFYPVPSQRGQQVRITMNNLVPGYYGLQFFDGQGRLAHQFDMNIQSDFINQLVTIPATFQKGIYQVRLISHQKVLAKKSILIF